MNENIGQKARKRDKEISKQSSKLMMMMMINDFEIKGEEIDGQSIYHWTILIILFCGICNRNIVSIIDFSSILYKCEHYKRHIETRNSCPFTTI